MALELSESDIIDEIHRLRTEQRTIQDRIRKLVTKLSMTKAAVECLRCGWTWVPNDPTRLPLCCARCGSAGWNRPPLTTRTRTPQDPPRKSWKKRRGNRPRQSRDLGTLPIDAFPPTADEIATRKAQIMEPIAVTTAPAPTVPIPPSVRAAIPPPPSPRPIALSEQFRAITAPEPEPQPESVASQPTYKQIVRAYEAVEADEPDMVIARDAETAEIMASETARLQAEDAAAEPESPAEETHDE